MLFKILFACITCTLKYCSDNCHNSVFISCPRVTLRMTCSLVAPKYSRAMPGNRTSVLITRTSSQQAVVISTPKRRGRKAAAEPVRARHKVDRKKDLFKRSLQKSNTDPVDILVDSLDFDGWQDEPLQVFDLEFESDFNAVSHNKVYFNADPVRKST